MTSAGVTESVATPTGLVRGDVWLKGRGNPYGLREDHGCARDEEERECGVDLDHIRRVYWWDNVVEALSAEERPAFLEDIESHRWGIYTWRWLMCFAG
jgi:hypothetical protein